ncbi:DUF881 domain-containing protein [Streptomyces sp. NPDC020096]
MSSGREAAMSTDEPPQPEERPERQPLPPEAASDDTPKPQPGPEAEPKPEPESEPEPAPEAEPETEPESEAPQQDGARPGDEEERPVPEAPAAQLTGPQRLVKGLWPPRFTRAQLIFALLLFALGLGLAIQVRTASDNGVLRGARQEDLVRILSELDARTQRLEDEKRGLDNQRTELQNSSNQAAEAQKQTQQKAQQLGVLAGTVAAQGPGITLTIRPSGGAVSADELLDTLQELRAAGAEAIQINDVRAVAGTYFTDAGSRVSVDGHQLSPPYVFKVVGNPPDLQPALNIPGGVVQTLQKEQATVSVVASQKIVVDALRSAKQPDYARSSGQ